jgi:bifunctional DNA-binding transcriptional regulator/antitoxin component of YhaV-PrlF toxin-antitoxin module
MKKMLAEMLTQSQITLPDELISKFNLTKGDKLKIFEKDGLICLSPKVIFPYENLTKQWPHEFLNILGSLNETDIVEPDELSFAQDARREEM